QQVARSQAGARGLVAVGRPDAAPRRADFSIALRGLAGAVERTVVVEREMRAIGDEQVVFPNVDALLAEHLDFLRERYRVDHHAVADDAQLTAPENGAR